MHSFHMFATFRYLCYYFTVIFTLIVLCYYMCTDHVQRSKIQVHCATTCAQTMPSGFAYSPGGSYLLPLSHLTIFLYSSITLQVVEDTTTKTRLTLIDSHPSLIPSKAIIHYKNSYDIHYRKYRFWYYYLYPGSNFSINVCVDRSGPMEVFILKGTVELNNWVARGRDSIKQFELHHRHVEQCPSVTHIKYTTQFEDLYGILVYNNRGNESVLTIEYVLERHEYLSDGLLDISTPTCGVTTGGMCTTHIPFEFKYKYIFITVSIPTSVDWTENVKTKIVYSLRKNVCLILICVYFLLCWLLRQVCFVHSNCHAII